MEDNQPIIMSEPPVAAKVPNKRKRLLLVVLLMAAVLIVAGLFALRSSSNDTSKKVSPETYTVEITDEGFVPQTLSVPAGSKVKWVNKTNEPYRIAANPQPTHSSFPALDSKEPIGPDGEYSFEFTKKGTIVYNNHFKPTENNGEIRVEDASN